MNPQYVPERLNDFLSHMLCQKVKVLPADFVRIADTSSLQTIDKQQCSILNFIKALRF